MDQHSFLFQALIYLAAAVLLVPFSKKLGLGSVLGYLVAGIIIGPAVLRFVGSEGEDIMHFAEFGVVMMLFIIGLELEPRKLWRSRGTIIGLGALQAALTSSNKRKIRRIPSFLCVPETRAVRIPQNLKAGIEGRAQRTDLRCAPMFMNDAN